MVTDTTLRLAGIVLAAGRSARLGQAKPHVMLHGKPLLRRAVDLLSGICDPLLAVVRDQGTAALLAGTRTRVALNHRPATGVGGSIACALAALDEQTAHSPAAVIILLADQYQVAADELAALIEQWRKQPQFIAAAGYANTIGPPVIFPAHYFAMLKNLPRTGAKKLLQSERANDRLSVVMIESAATDLDTPADLDALRQFEHQTSPD